jgi:hypothetical protein
LVGNLGPNAEQTGALSSAHTAAETQDLSRSRGGELASTKYVATSYTFSPRSLETQLSTRYPQMGNYANINANNLPRTSWVDPSGDQSTSQNYLPVNETYTSQQGLSRSRGEELASTTYVATSYTLSPKSQETPLSGDHRRSTSPGQELGTEDSLAGISNFDFSFNFNRQPSWSGSDSSLLPFGSIGRCHTRFC